MSIRRTALVAATALALVAGSTHAQEKLNLRLDWAASGYHSPIHLANQKGWFAKEGLVVTVAEGNGSNTTVQLVDAGQIDVGFAALSSMAFARSKGAKITSIAGIFRKGDLALLVPADSPLLSVKDLKGRQLLTTAGSFEAPFLDAFFGTGGLKRGEINLSTVDVSAKLPLYFAGKADGAFASVAFNNFMATKQRPSRMLQFADVGLNLPGFGVVVSEAALAKRGDVLKKFASVLAGAWTYAINGNQEETVAAHLKAREQMRLDPATLRAQLNDSIPFLHTPATKHLPIGVQAEADWADTIKVMEAANTIGAGSKPSEYFSNGYLDLALISAIAGSK